jgi:hypothetical protein
MGRTFAGLAAANVYASTFVNRRLIANGIRCERPGAATGT